MTRDLKDKLQLAVATGTTVTLTASEASELLVKRRCPELHPTTEHLASRCELEEGHEDAHLTFGTRWRRP